MRTSASLVKSGGVGAIGEAKEARLQIVLVLWIKMGVVEM
jgi:hypothetical protein